MKVSAFVIFLAIVITIYGLANFYIYYRGLHSLPQGNSSRLWFSVIFWALVSAYILARILDRHHSGIPIDVLTWIGSLWMAFMLYLFLSVLLIDIGRLIVWAAHIPVSRYVEPQKLRLILFFTVLGVVTFAVLAGFINARNQRFTRLDLKINKEIQGKQTLKIALASDIHLGTLIGTRGVTQLVKKLNAMEPDIILLAGDIVDEDISPVIRNNLGEHLTELRAPFGIYAITGNHEYIGGVEEAVSYLEAHGIKFLRDTATKIDGRFYLAGREDRDSKRFAGLNRKSLDAILKDVDTSLPLILMDHQPFHFDTVTGRGVDLQISGHTHHGQIWPLNYITNRIYEVSWGYLRKKDTHFYVSSGFGTWGPPVRLGNYPEVVEINLTFGK